MTPDEAYEVPMDDANLEDARLETESIDQPQETLSDEVIEEAIDPEVEQARAAFDDDRAGDETSADMAGVDDAEFIELATPFVGQWNQLISTTNWEKGQIIHQWRQALIESGASASNYSDDAWARRVGGVTAPHIGRLRRVFDRFGSTQETYEGLYWSHFLAALDWDDAPLWLEGASQSGWSVAGMREQRWQAHGAVDSQRPTASQIVDVDLDEDVVSDPGKGTREYGDEPGTAGGKTYENADFGDEDELQSLAGPGDAGSPGGVSAVDGSGQPSATPVQPFAGLPELPDDLADAIEMMKLAILRHKSNKWEKVSVETVAKYLEAIGVLMRSP